MIASTTSFPPLMLPHTPEPKARYNRQRLNAASEIFFIFLTRRR
jgi:hypothetical protein